MAMELCDSIAQRTTNVYVTLESWINSSLSVKHSILLIIKIAVAGYDHPSVHRIYDQLRTN